MADMGQERVRRRQAADGIFAYMESRGIKRVWLARKLNMPRNTIWNYEHTDTPPPERWILDACKELEVLPERFGYVRPKATQRRAS